MEIILSTKGKEILKYNDFLYHFHSTNRNSTKKYWRCEQRAICNARCVTNADTERHIQILKTGVHTHEARKVQANVRKIVGAIKRKATEEPNRPPSAIIREEIVDVQDEELLQALPERNTLKRNINRFVTNPLSNSPSGEETLPPQSIPDRGHCR